MAFRGVPNRVSIEVRHILDRKQIHDVLVTHYCATVAAVRRPGRGMATHSVRCGHCGHRIEFTVLCAGSTRRRRVWALALGIVMIGFGAGALFGVQVAHWPANVPLAMLLTVVSVPVLAAGTAVVMYSAHFAGVRSPQLRQEGARAGSHLAEYGLRPGRKRRAGRLVSVHRHAAETLTTDRPSGPRTTVDRPESHPNG